MSKRPLVSVVMPVYNVATYLPEALDSILRQTYSDFEFIAVDDGSSDESLSVLKTYAESDRRLRIISRPNTGIAGALNDGIQAVTGELIARMDGDDISEPDRFMEQIRFLRKHSDVAAVGTGVHRMDTKGVRFETAFPTVKHEKIEKQLLLGNGMAIIHATVIMRTEVFSKCGGYRNHCRNIHEDTDLFLRMSRVGKLANIPKALYWYRQHDRSNVATVYKTVAANDALMEILQEAYQVRGLPFPPDFIEGWREAGPEWYWHWRVWRELRAKQQLPALWASIRAIGYRPHWLCNWKALACAVRGR